MTSDHACGGFQGIQGRIFALAAFKFVPAFAWPLGPSAAGLLATAI